MIITPTLSLAWRSRTFVVKGRPKFLQTQHLLSEWWTSLYWSPVEKVGRELEADWVVASGKKINT